MFDGFLEIHRRQDLCRAELGNWWEREHGKVYIMCNMNRILLVY